MSHKNLTTRDHWVFGAFALDSTARVLYRDGAPVALTPKQVDTLIVLVREAGQVVERERLMQEVWADTFVEDGGLTRNISVIRKVLADGMPDGRDAIETIPKRGYRFLAPVTRRTVPPVHHATPPVAPSPSRTNWVRVAVLITLVAVAGLILTAVNRPATPRTTPTSLAVLPFELVGADEADTYLATGLADLLTTRLTGLASLAVRGTQSTRAFAGVDPVAAGRELGTDVVITGALRREGDRLRLTVRVIDVATGLPTLAGSFDERAGAVLKLEDALTDAVLGLLVPTLTPRDRLARAAAGSRDQYALDAYLRARHLLATRAPDAVEAAIVAFQQAIDHDAAFALAHAGLAHAYIVQGDYQYRWPRDVFPKAKAAALRAISLDGALAEAHAALGEIAWEYDWDWDTAEASLTRALALAPDDALINQWLAEFNVAVGRFDDARRYLARAEQLAPRDFAPASVSVALSYWMRQFDDAITRADRAAGLGGFSPVPQLYKQFALWTLGRYDEARVVFDAVAPAITGLPIHDATLALYQWRSGDAAGARRQLVRLEALRGQQYVDAYMLASAYAAMQDDTEALRLLNQALADRSTFIPYLPHDPFYSALTRRTGFREVLQRAGHPAAAAQ